MKILIVMIRWKGGVGRAVSSWKKKLEEMNHKVEVISREDDLKCYSFKNSFGVLKEEVRSRYYDILFTQDWSCAIPLITFKNHFVCFHGVSPKFLGRHFQKMLSLFKDKKLIVISDSLKERFKNAKLIYNAVDDKEFYDKKSKRKYFGWISRDYDLYSDEEYDDMAKKLNLEVSIAKDIPPERMNDWYNTLKVFANFPPWYAGFNLCWVEAIKAGVPKVLGNENGVGITMARKNIKEFDISKQTNKLIKLFAQQVYY